MTLTPGTKLDGYEILGPLGAGGMGEVHRARDSVLKRDVAIKVLPVYFSQDPDRLRRFEQEAQAAAALNHPNILAVHRFGTFEGAPYLVAELLDGTTLGQLLTPGALPVRMEVAFPLFRRTERKLPSRPLAFEHMWSAWTAVSRKGLPRNPAPRTGHLTETVCSSAQPLIRLVAKRTTDVWAYSTHALGTYPLCLPPRAW